MFGPFPANALPAGTTASADSCRVHAVVAFRAAGSASNPVPAPRQASTDKGSHCPPTAAAST